MQEVTGQVSSVMSRDFQKYKLWSFQLEGSQRYYRTGKHEPGVKEGQWVTFTEKNGQVDPTSVRDAPAGAVAQSETVPATSASAKPEPVDVGHRIRVQAARADAARIVCAALANDHLPHPANAAKGKRLDLLLGYVEEVTKELLRQEEAA